MRFSTWLWEQSDAPGLLQDISKICYSDVNNGCADAKFTAQQWIAHFDEKHPDKKDILTEMVFRAYIEYLKEVRK